MRRFSVIFILIMFMFYTAACSTQNSTTQKYLRALENTQNADTIQSKTEARISIDLSKASEEAKELLKNFKDISFNIDEIADNKNMRIESSNYISFGKLSWGTKIYVNGDEIFLKVNDKYLKLDSKDQSSIVSADGSINKEYRELVEEMSGIWKDTVQKEILTKEGNFIESTPDGDIKITQLSLELNDEKFKKILENLGLILSKSEIAKKTAIESAHRFGNVERLDEEEKNKVIADINEWFDKIQDNLKAYNNKFSVENLKLTAKIDKDSYIIDEVFEGEFVIKHQGEIRISFNVNTTRWDINRKLSVNIPQISEEDLIDEESLQEEMRETFSELFGTAK